MNEIGSYLHLKQVNGLLVSHFFFAPIFCFLSFMCVCFCECLCVRSDEITRGGDTWSHELMHEEKHVSHQHTITQRKPTIL